jgi:hypothetical protein
MVDCVDGFPHGGAKGNIGGFLEDAAPGMLGYLDQPASGTVLSATSGPFGYRWVEEWTGEPLVWEPIAAPPIGTTTDFEVDVRPDFSGDYVWDLFFAYRPTDAAPWVVANFGKHYSFLLLLQRVTGDVVFWVYDKDDEGDLDDLLTSGEVGAAVLEARLEAAMEGSMALRGSGWLTDQGEFKVTVSMTYTLEQTLSCFLSVVDADGVEIGNAGTTWLDTITELPGFDSAHEWLPPATYTTIVAQPRYAAPVGCPLADPLPTYTPRVVDLAAPSACATGMSTPDEPYTDPFLDTFRVQVPIGDSPDAYRVAIESVCDKPMTLSGIEWSGWLFNNSRRI